MLAAPQAAAQGSTLADAPPAPALPADWTKQLAEQHESIVTDRVRIHVFRLRPGDDLLGGIASDVNANHIQAAVLLSAVGSLTQASIRYANQPEAHIHTGHFEIVSITGTVEEGGGTRAPIHRDGAGHDDRRAFDDRLQNLHHGRNHAGGIDRRAFHSRDRHAGQRLG